MEIQNKGIRVTRDSKYCKRVNERYCLRENEGKMRLSVANAAATRKTKWEKS